MSLVTQALLYPNEAGGAKKEPGDLPKVNNVANVIIFYDKRKFSVNMGRAGDVSKAFDALSHNFLQARQGFERPGLMEGVPCPWQGGWNKMSFQPNLPVILSFSRLAGWAVGQVINCLRLCSEGAN